VVEESSTAASYRIYVTNEASGDLSIIDSATMEIVSTVPLGKRPRGIHALSPDGTTLFSANGPSNDVSVIDLATQTVTKTIPVGDSPWGAITLQP
jgi:YVTN family beta-propeller protein